MEDVVTTLDQKEILTYYGPVFDFTVSFSVLYHFMPFSSLAIAVLPTHESLTV